MNTKTLLVITVTAAFLATLVKKRWWPKIKHTHKNPIDKSQVEDAAAEPHHLRHLAGCEQPLKIDFNELTHGDYVHNQYADYGLTLSATGGFHRKPPRVFDTFNPGSNENGYFGLGSPNEACNPSGPGVGTAGSPGSPGDNCIAQGNALIVQERDSNPEDDNHNGGSIIFTFSPPAKHVFGMGFLDIDDEASAVTVYGEEGGQAKFDLPILGENSFQELDVNLGNVAKIKVTFKQSLAISFIKLCPGKTTPEAPEATTTPPMTDPPTSHLDAVFLLIGQSNMAGRAYMDPGDTEPIANTWLLRNDTLDWVPAKNPLNWYSTYRKRDVMQRIGLGYGFSRKLQRALPGLNVGLVVQARGGTRISYWQKSHERGYYANAVKLALEAKQSGPLKAVLWHQGETDRSRTSTYMSRLTTLINDLRTDLGDPNLPFVAGQLLNPSLNGKYDLFNEMIVDLPNVVNHTGVVLTDARIGTHDDIHFDRRGQIKVGKRYCREFLALATSI